MMHTILTAVNDAFSQVNVQQMTDTIKQADVIQHL